ncbi:hypothetical protein BN973_00001 [Mycobacterium triplex]|uniref:Uncharacterized protein n=1 Tax=Mycobacterium triplex TaxID=47839 RepID=A0A024JQR2_9MYCO|nr:hypothetical protein BN973_00001 [Mycobacterium triplex]
MMSATNAAAAGSIAPAAVRAARSCVAGRNTRSDKQVPPAATGGNTACNRTANPPTPIPDNWPSTQGCASSRRRPAANASRWASRRTAASSAKRMWLRRNPFPSSTHTASGAVTSTSVVPSAHSNGSRIPAPVSSVCNTRRLARTSVSPSIPPDSARMAAATTLGRNEDPGGIDSAARRSRTRSISDPLTPPWPSVRAAISPGPVEPPPSAPIVARAASRRVRAARPAAAELSSTPAAAGW